MDIEKLIEQLKYYGTTYAIGDNLGKEVDGSDELMLNAATALSTLQAENAEMQQQLNEFSEFLCHMTGGLLSKTNYTAQEMIAAADDYQQKVCGECDLRVENEKLLAENNMLRKMQPVELNGETARSLSLALEVSQLRAELEQVKRERDADVDRLAAYEDTGLEPEEIELLEKQGDLYVDACGELPLKRIRELAQADREGRCVVLPIKVPGWGWYCNREYPNAISAYFAYPSQVVDCMEKYVLKESKEEAEAALRREQE